jgi:manganese/zinc/iron transport system ATP- binding protein
MNPPARQNNGIPAVSFRGVTVSYAQKPVLRDVSVEIPAGVLSAIMGPNGAGKTTMMRALLKMIPLDAGEIAAFGKPIDEMRRRIAYVPQTESVDWDFPITAGEVVMMGRYPHQKPLRRPSPLDHAAAAAALDLVRMSAYKDRHIRKLSGGQQQRIFIARALAQEADLLLLDEPFVGIDAKTEEALMALMRTLAGQGKTLIVVNHDLGKIGKFDFLVLINQTVTAYGPPREAATEQNLNRTYGGGLAFIEQAEMQLREGQR